MSSKESSIQPYNTSLDHVPEPIQAQLSILVDLVHQSIKKHLVMVWLFGSYARGDAINDRRVDPKTGVLSEYHSDVDILVIVGGKFTIDKDKKWRQLSRNIKQNPGITASIHIIKESVNRVTDGLKRSDYFFLDVIREGIVLYGEDHKLPDPVELSIEERRALSIDYLESVYQSADASKITLALHYNLDDHASAMCSLHQLTERLFYTYLLVFTLYQPRSHKLDDLRERVATINVHVKTIFPLAAEEDVERFEFLNAAYVDSRYKRDYKVDPVVLDYLIERVSEFQAWVLAECLNVIDGFIPDQNYSKSYKQPGELLNLEKIKTEKLPQAVIQEQLAVIRVAEEERDSALLREQTERDEKDRLLKKLRDAGLEP